MAEEIGPTQSNLHADVRADAVVAPGIAQSATSWPRAPAVPVAAAFAAGILLDRLMPLPLVAWLLVAGGVWSGWFLLRRRASGRAAAVLLLMCCSALGAARHHLFWGTIDGDDVSRFARQQPQLVHLTGVVESPPEIQSRPDDALLAAWPQVDRTVCTIRCRAVRNGNSWLPVGGRVRLVVGGHMLHAAPGDVVELDGWLSLPRGVQNPGAFDFREYLWRQGVRALVYADHPDAVRRVGRSGSGWVARQLAGVRNRSEELFVKHLREERLPVATALFMGSRAGIPSEIRDAFVESGTMHVLAISGVHISVFVAFLWFCCRILNLGRLPTAVVIGAAAIGYSLLTGGSPPVVRATTFVLIALVGYAVDRAQSLGNTLALAALGILAWSPAALFDAGGQLSFLAVAAILWSRFGRITLIPPAKMSPVDALVAESTWWRRAVRRELKRIRCGIVLMLAVWIFTAPLVAARFHLVSPVGLVLNVLLMPLGFCLLWLGYAFLLVGHMVPPLSFVFGWALDEMLRFVLWLIQLAADIHLGHLYTAGPRFWWLCGYYGLIAAALAYQHRPAVHRRVWLGVLGWTVFGLAAALGPAPAGPLRVTALSVGHGCAVLIETPDGKNLLYDAGSIQDSSRAERAVTEALWARGNFRLDGVIVSHADVDHFNGIPGLLRSVPVGTFLTSEQCAGTSQSTVAVLSESLRQRKPHIVSLRQGDRLALGEGVLIDVLHPESGRAYSTDNASSVVVLIEYRGRRVLLTGDLEEDGLLALLSQPGRPVDVMLSPHHGSPGANSSALVRWAQPRYAIISGGRRASQAETGSWTALCANYGPGVELLSTFDRGAIECEVDAEGELVVRPYRFE